MSFIRTSFFGKMGYPMQIMPIKASTYSQELSTWVESKINQITDQESGGRESQLKNLAHLSYDLLSWARKMEKLNAQNHLDQREKQEVESVTRLVGTLILCLKKYCYSDGEMMDSLINRYKSFSYANSTGSAR